MRAPLHAAGLLALLACAETLPPSAGEAGGDTVEVSTGVETGDKGALVLRVLVSAPNDVKWELSLPEVEGLSYGPAASRTEQLGGRSVLTQRLPLRGSPGRYIVEGVCAQPDNGDPASCAEPLYLDLGEPPDRSAMADIAEPERLYYLPLRELAAAAALAALGLWAYRRRAATTVEAPPAPLAPPEPPDLAALRRWEAVRRDASLSDFDKALALSEIFRAYAEAVLLFPARAWSTTQTLEHLTQLTQLPQENVPRARRLLRATDRVKYAEDRPTAQFFEDLDSDLRAFIDSTRSKQWGVT
jgi:hypothetical protein